MSPVSEMCENLSLKEKARTLQLTQGVSDFLTSFKCSKLDKSGALLFDETPYSQSCDTPSGTYSSHWLTDYYSTQNYATPLHQETSYNSYNNGEHRIDIGSNNNRSNNISHNNNLGSKNNMRPLHSSKNNIKYTSNNNFSHFTPSQRQQHVSSDMNYATGLQSLPSQQQQRDSMNNTKRSWGRVPNGAQQTGKLSSTAPTKGKLPLFSYKK